jgi:hypothetical protein
MSETIKANQGKLLLIGALLLAAGVMYFVRSGGKPARDEPLLFVCVATGETYTMDRGPTYIPPLKNPDTGEETLLPGTRRDGEVYVTSRWRELLARLGAANRCVDPQTLLVRKSP